MPGLMVEGASRLTRTAATPVSVLLIGAMTTDGVTTTSTKSPSVAAELTQVSLWHARCTGVRRASDSCERL